MTNDTPIACSLADGDLESRLAAIAKVGKEGLVDHGTEGDRHLLRFRSSAGTLKRLEEIVAAERECCPFLELSLSGEGDELVLSIAAPKEGQAIADQLANAFLTV